MIAPLWQRALEERRREQLAAAPRTPSARRKRRGGGHRVHPPARIGDIFGDKTVIALLPRDSTSNERVRVRCANGHDLDAYVFNLRTAKPCKRCPRRGVRIDWTAEAFTADEIADLIRAGCIRRRAEAYELTPRGQSVNVDTLKPRASRALVRLRGMQGGAS